MFGTKCEWLLSLIEWVKLTALPLFILSTPSSETKRSVEYIMGEVMICRGGGRYYAKGGDYGGGGGSYGPGGTESGGGSYSGGGG